MQEAVAGAKLVDALLSSGSSIQGRRNLHSSDMMKSAYALKKALHISHAIRITISGIPPDPVVAAGPLFSSLSRLQPPKERPFAAVSESDFSRSRRGPSTTPKGNAAAAVLLAVAWWLLAFVSFLFDAHIPFS